MKTKIVGVLLSFAALLNCGCQTDETQTLPGDGSVRLKLLLSDSTRSKKLSYYTEFFEAPDVGFKAQQKVKFEYNAAGELIKKIVYGFDADQRLTELNYFTFTHSNNLVTKIAGYTTGTNSPGIEYVYEYLPDRSISAIHATNYAAGVNSTVSFSYDTAVNRVIATYSFSNGERFKYDFFLKNNNIVSDTTLKGTDLCNTGEYTYDDGINPFNQLGYVEFELSNYSFNNRSVESVRYVGCAFPSLIPQSYTYVYDDQRYPIVATTIYASGKRSQRILTYM